MNENDVFDSEYEHEYAKGSNGSRCEGLKSQVRGDKCYCTHRAIVALLLEEAAPNAKTRTFYGVKSSTSYLSINGSAGLFTESIYSFITY